MGRMVGAKSFSLQLQLDQSCQGGEVGTRLKLTINKLLIFSHSNESMIFLLSSPQEEFTLTTKELVSATNYRDQNLTEQEIEPKLDSSSLPLFHSPHALLGLLTLGCIALQMIMGKG